MNAVQHALPASQLRRLAETKRERMCAIKRNKWIEYDAENRNAVLAIARGDRLGSMVPMTSLALLIAKGRCPLSQDRQGPFRRWRAAAELASEKPRRCGGAAKEEKKSLEITSLGVSGPCMQRRHCRRVWQTDTDDPEVWWGCARGCPGPIGGRNWTVDDASQLSVGPTRVRRSTSSRCNRLSRFATTLEFRAYAGRSSAKTAQRWLSALVISLRAGCMLAPPRRWLPRRG
jgi:hypothetical protein